MLKTEMRNPRTTHIDKRDTNAILKIMNDENRNAVEAVEATLDQLTVLCDETAKRMARGGRLFYMGAGTSGRLGVLDASECPPTFGVSEDTVIGIIAGGDRCLRSAAEGAEDSAEAGIQDLAGYDITENDVVVGISAAGGAAYVVAALRYAKSKGALTASISSNANTAIEKEADIAIVADTGAEVVTGSTRMKAGTSQKLILNMLSTTVMIKTGKVYENMMINLKPSNIKLRDRVVRITGEILGCEEAEAIARLEENNWSIRQTVEANNRKGTV